MPLASHILQHIALIVSLLDLRNYVLQSKISSPNKRGSYIVHIIQAAMAAAFVFQENIPLTQVSPLFNLNRFSCILEILSSNMAILIDVHIGR